jgi:hypothetical protein
MSTRMCILDILVFIVDGGKQSCHCLDPYPTPPPPPTHTQKGGTNYSEHNAPEPCLPNHCPPPSRDSPHRAGDLPATPSHTSTDGGHQDPQNQNLISQPETITCQSYWRSLDIEKSELSTPEGVSVCIPTLKNLLTDE